MFECAPSTSRLPQLRDALTRGCLTFDYCRLGLGIVPTIRAGLPAAIENAGKSFVRTEVSEF